MRRLTQTRFHPAIFRTIALCIALLTWFQSPVFAVSAATESQAVAQAPIITVPEETKIQLVVTRPVLAKTAAVGGQIYAATAFPVTINGNMAIPAGTYAQGVIDAMTRPTWKSSRAEFQIHFAQFIFANGYVVELRTGTVLSSAYVRVSSSSDVLLDNGSPLELVLQNPLSLDAKNIQAAVRVSKPPQWTQFRSATRCVPTPGTSGTPDTVIPGSSGSPGTSDIVIPGTLGMPDTVIPGIPPTPATPPTIIPGTPSTAGTTCPGPPIVSSTPFPEAVHKESFRLTTTASVAGQPFFAGTYQVTWQGSGPAATVDILQKGAVVTRVQARIVTLDKKSPKSEVNLQTNSAAPDSVVSIQFKGSTIALFFN